MRKPFVALAFLVAACNPGAGSIHQPGTTHGADATLGGGDAERPHDSGWTSDVGAPPSPDAAEAAPDAADGADAEVDMPLPPPMPSQVYIAETDGTIHFGTFDPDTEQLTLAGDTFRSGSLNFLAFDAGGERLYAARGNAVDAYSLAADGTPTYLGTADAGIGGTHLEVDATRSFAFVASYGGDEIAVLPLDENGAPADATMSFGGTADPDFCRRAHQVRVHRSNRFVYVPCLASDHVAIFELDTAAGTVTPLPPAPTAAGAGPRHMDFHPTLPVAYVIGEKDDTITIFDLDENTGALTNPSIVSTRPQNPTELGPASDVHVSPDGRYVAGINRNPRNELVIFDVDATGALTHAVSVSNGGEHARTFTFTPSGGHILVGNSNSQHVVVFRFADGTPVEGQKLGGFDARVFYVGIRPR